jgi:hypothetical protein
MTNAITNPINFLATALQGSTPVSQPDASSAAPTSTALHQRINRSPSPALSDLPRPAPNAALTPPAEPEIKTPISALPEPFLIGTLQYCNGPDADNAVTLSKQFKNLTIASRKKTVLALAEQPERVSQEKLPTLFELWRLGIPNPHLTNILHTMKSELPGQPVNDGVITRNTKAHAVLQQTQREFGQAGGMARRAVNGQATYIRYVNAQGQTHGFGSMAQRIVNGQATDIGHVNAQGQTHGFGIRTWQNEPGKKYTGNFRNGQIDGFGYSEFANGDRFEGTYIEGRRNGPGKEFLANGGRFEGTFVNDRPHGPGKYFLANGDRFEGTYVDGRANGPGKHFFRKGGRVEGTFVDGIPNGPGKMFAPNGDRAEGTFVDGQLNGPGKGFSANGDRSKGTFVNGLMQGPVKQFLTNGDRVEATCIDGQFHGQATFFHPNGQQTEYSYVNGQRHGPCIETLLNAEQRTTHYDMGRLVG